MTTKTRKSIENTSNTLIDAMIDTLRANHEINEYAAREEGIPYYGLGGVVLYVKHAALSTRSYALAFQKRSDAFNRKTATLQKDDPEYKALTIRLMAEVVAEAVITRIETAEGNQLPWGKGEKEKFVNLLCDIPHKQDELVSFASNITNYSKKLLEAQAKNSAKS